MTKPLNPFCDECGRKMPKAHRVYAGVRYCTCCYARVFVKKPCAQCGEESRLPKQEMNAICRNCEKNKPCIRCGKTNFAIGKITEYGPVCNSCSVYFREARPCGACGTTSLRLSVVKRRGIDIQVCPRCARQDYKSCKKCGRYRLLQADNTGAMICRKCVEGGLRKCQSCNQDIPAGKGSRCDACYWSATLQKRIHLNSAAFTKITFAKYFEQFGNWLSCRIGSHKATLTINNYLQAFQSVEKHWGGFPSYEILLETFSQDFFRDKKPMLEWLQYEGLVVLSQEVKESYLDKKLIDKALNELDDGSMPAKILHLYTLYLNEKVSSGKTSIRSVRLALRPASSLLKLTLEAKKEIPTQLILDQFLIQSPGQLAAVTGFVNFLNRKFQLNITPRSDEKKAREFRRKQIEQKIVKVLAAKETSFPIEKWVKICLEYFHDIYKSDLKGFSMDWITANMDSSFTVVIKNKNYWLPSIEMAIADPKSIQK